MTRKKETVPRGRPTGARNIDPQNEILNFLKQDHGLPDDLMQITMHIRSLRVGREKAQAEWWSAAPYGKRKRGHKNGWTTEEKNVAAALKRLKASGLVGSRIKSYTLGHTKREHEYFLVDRQRTLPRKNKKQISEIRRLLSLFLQKVSASQSLIPIKQLKDSILESTEKTFGRVSVKSVEKQILVEIKARTDAGQLAAFDRNGQPVRVRPSGRASKTVFVKIFV